jgi:hypothetical protein
MKSIHYEDLHHLIFSIYWFEIHKFGPEASKEDITHIQVWMGDNIKTYFGELGSAGSE